MHACIYARVCLGARVCVSACTFESVYFCLVHVCASAVSVGVCLSVFVCLSVYMHVYGCVSVGCMTVCMSVA